MVSWPLYKFFADWQSKWYVVVRLICSLKTLFHVNQASPIYFPGAIPQCCGNIGRSSPGSTSSLFEATSWLGLLYLTYVQVRKKAFQKWFVRFQVFVHLAAVSFRCYVHNVPSKAIYLNVPMSFPDITCLLDGWRPYPWSDATRWRRSVEWVGSEKSRGFFFTKKATECRRGHVGDIALP